MRRLHLRLGPKHKHQPLNFSLSHFHRSAIRLLLPHLRIGTSVITGTILFHLCNPMSGVLFRPLHSQLCLVLEVIYGEDPPAIPRVQLLPSSHQRQATRKPKKTMCLGISGVASSRHRLVLFTFFVGIVVCLAIRSKNSSLLRFYRLVSSMPLCLQKVTTLRLAILCN